MAFETPEYLIVAQVLRGKQRISLLFNSICIKILNKSDLSSAQKKVKNKWNIISFVNKGANLQPEVWRTEDTGQKFLCLILD